MKGFKKLALSCLIGLLTVISINGPVSAAPVLPPPPNQPLSAQYLEYLNSLIEKYWKFYGTNPFEPANQLQGLGERPTPAEMAQLDQLLEQAKQHNQIDFEVAESVVNDGDLWSSQHLSGDDYEHSQAEWYWEDWDDYDDGSGIDLEDPPQITEPAPEAPAAPVTNGNGGVDTGAPLIGAATKATIIRLNIAAMITKLGLQVYVSEKCYQQALDALRAVLTGVAKALCRGGLTNDSMCQGIFTYDSAAPKDDAGSVCAVLQTAKGRLICSDRMSKRDLCQQVAAQGGFATLIDRLVEQTGSNIDREWGGACYDQAMVRDELRRQLNDMFSDYCLS